MVMRQLPTGEPSEDRQWDQTGKLIAPAEGHFLDETAAAGITDLFAFSHGWGTSQDSALALYNRMCPMIRDAAHNLAGIGKVGFAGIYWPSLWFPPTPATPPPAAGAPQASEGAPVAISAGTAALSGSDIASSLLPGFADPAQQDALTQIGKLIDQGQTAAGSAESDASKQQRLQQIGQLIKSLVPPSAPAGAYEGSDQKR